jgi:multiple sugar transport system ATP-binding protein
MTAKLVIENLKKVYDGREVVKDFTLSVADREFVALLGPSGCGKSTILAMIAGFEHPDAGTVSIDGRSVDALQPHRRKVGLVMQDYAVFSRMTVRQNLEFGLKMQSIPKSDRAIRISEFVERLSLGDILKRKGGTLNLSEMQRVALARALITRPPLLLLDEPMSNLDASIRSHLRGELKLIQQEFDQTVLYVSHDQIEAMSMADRIAVMREGTIEQIGTPAEVYLRPRNRYIAQFLGEPSINLIHCTVEQRFGSPMVRMSSNSSLPLPKGIIFEGAAILAIRPHDVHASHPADDHTALGKVVDVENLGAEHVLHLEYGQQHLAVVTTPRSAAIGEVLHLTFDLTHAHLIDPASGEVVASALGGETL